MVSGLAVRKYVKYDVNFRVIPAAVIFSEVVTGIVA